MDRQAHWQGIYTGKQETGVSWFQERPNSSIEQIERTGFGQTARIIDVGGGASRLVDCLLDLGYVHVSVLDIADAALAKARARLGARGESVEWVAADVAKWTPASAFDIWHDRAVFHFLTEFSDRKAYATAMAAAVRIGGQAIIGAFALDGPKRCSGLPVCRYGAGRLAAGFSPQFRSVETFLEDHITPGGDVQKFLFCRMLRV